MRTLHSCCVGPSRLLKPGRSPPVAARLRGSPELTAETAYTDCHAADSSPMPPTMLIMVASRCRLRRRKSLAIRVRVHERCNSRTLESTHQRDWPLVPPGVTLNQGRPHVYSHCRSAGPRGSVLVVFRKPETPQTCYGATEEFDVPIDHRAPATCSSPSTMVQRNQLDHSCVRSAASVTFDLPLRDQTRQPAHSKGSSASTPDIRHVHLQDVSDATKQHLGREASLLLDLGEVHEEAAVTLNGV